MSNVPKKKEKPKKEKKDAKVQPVKKADSDKPNFRGIVRIAGKDINGHVSFRHSLLRVRGLGHTLSVSISHVLSKELGISPDVEVGELSDEQIEQIDKVLFSLEKHGIFNYLLNRNKNPFDGTQKHVIMSDLAFAVTQDIEKMKKHYSWKGYRHAYSQKVRGQRTRNTGRTGMAVGVLRKAIIAAQGAAAQAKPGAEAATASPAPAKAEVKPQAKEAKTEKPQAKSEAKK